MPDEEKQTVRAQPRRVDMLHEAARLTDGDRNTTYGPPIINLTCAGELKQVARKYQQRTMAVGELEAIDQCLTKIARIMTGVFNEDNYVDLAAYAAIGGEIAEHRERGETNQREAKEMAERLKPEIHKPGLMSQQNQKAAESAVEEALS